MKEYYECIVEFEDRQDVCRIVYFKAKTVESTSEYLNEILKASRSHIAHFIFECENKNEKVKRNLITAELNCEREPKFIKKYFGIFGDKKNMNEILSRFNLMDIEE